MSSKKIQNDRHKLAAEMLPELMAVIECYMPSDRPASMRVADAMLLALTSATSKVIQSGFPATYEARNDALGKIHACLHCELTKPFLPR